MSFLKDSTLEALGFVLIVAGLAIGIGAALGVLAGAGVGLIGLGAGMVVYSWVMP